MGQRTSALLHGLLEARAAVDPARTAVVDPDGTALTYAQLDEQASRVAAFLQRHGVSAGDRVGVVLPKSGRAVAVLFGVLKAGGAYVPVDVNAPWERNLTILADCAVRFAFVTRDGIANVTGPPFEGTGLVAVDGETRGDVDHARVFGWSDVMDPEQNVVAEPVGSPDALAYVLYTSGSTGIPKGVMVTHRNALAFVDWCSEEFRPTDEDRFGNHAPFHFDLSVFDLFVSIKHGGELHLVGEALGKNPKALAAFIADRRLTVWYSTPSVLRVLEEHGDLGHRACRSLRLVLFAGEVFPVRFLRAVTKRWPWAEFHNLYGPTETNVCTSARIPLPIPDDRTHPYPIGWPCRHYRAMVLDASGEVVDDEEEGLLHMAGPGVFQGYWNRDAENATAFVRRDGTLWYNTGDVVRRDPQRGYVYLGRRDRMVKRHGYRIELGEIERALYQHDQIAEAAVVASNTESGTRVTAFLSSERPPRPSVIDLKAFCATHLPSFMSPDAFVWLDALPRTSTNKVDYQALLSAE